jgi:hypothetical protein
VPAQQLDNLLEPLLYARTIFLGFGHIGLGLAGHRRPASGAILEPITAIGTCTMILIAYIIGAHMHAKEHPDSCLQPQRTS